MAKKIIHIFLGSSIVEFEMERLQLTEFIRDLSDKFEDDFDIKIKPVICENVDTNVPRSGGKQDEYNELIKSSEMCFFIFFTRAGEFTCEEFDVAYKALTECGKPKIYVYFKNIPAGQTADPSLTKFMYKIDNEIKHYHGTFDDIDTIKLRILLNIKLQEMDFLEVKYKDGKCFAGGREVNKLDINKVSEFKNNSGLKDLREELAETEKVYFALKAHYDEKQGDENYYKEYSEVASKRANLLKLIEETEKEIFSLSLNMCKNAVHGEVTARQAMAYELFEKGDLRGANNILDFNEIKSEYLRRKAIREAEQKKDDIRYIREIKTKIEVLTAMTDYAERFAEIEALYEEIIPVAEESLVETDVLFDYATYLYTQNNFNKSAEIYTRIEELFENNSELATDENLARLYNNAGNLYRALNNHKKSEEFYLKAIAIREQLAKENPSAYNPDLASSYNNAGSLYNDLHQYNKAEEYHLKSITIREELAKGNPSAFNKDLAHSYNSAGVLYYNLHQYDKTEKYYLKSITIREELAKGNPSDFNKDLAQSYHNVGILYSVLYLYDRAEKYFLKAIPIYEELATENPSAFNPDLALSYYNVGAFYGNLHQYDKAEKYSVKTIGIREELAKVYPSAFNPDLAQSYNNARILYSILQKHDKTEEYSEKAIAIYEKLATENPSAFNPELAEICRDVGLHYDIWRQYDKAEKYYLKAISIYEKFATDNLSASYNDLSGCYHAVGNLYSNLRQYDKAEEYLLKYNATLEKLATENPSNINHYLARSYLGIGVLYDDKIKDNAKAEEYYLKAINLYEQLYRQDPEEYSENLCKLYRWISAVYMQTGDSAKAEEYKNKAEKLK